MITGVGIVILLWSVIKVLNSTEMTDESYLGGAKGKEFTADVHGLFLDYLYRPDSDDSRE